MPHEKEIINIVTNTIMLLECLTNIIKNVDKIVKDSKDKKSKK